MDQQLFHLINERWTSPPLDLFMAAMSDLEIWKPLLVVVGLYALIFRGFKGRAFVFCVGVTLLISDSVVVPALKSAVGRLRAGDIIRESGHVCHDCHNAGHVIDKPQRE